MIKSKKLNAFSLIELSIVILIIGILIAGVTKGSSLIKKAQLKTAQNLTTSSPVAGIKDLALWFETSLDSSFLVTERVDGAEISLWHDNNPQVISKNDATQEITANKPTYREGAFSGGIPGISFDGTDDQLDFDGSFIVYQDYTVFVVEQKKSDDEGNFFLGGTDVEIDNTNLQLGYTGVNSRIKFSQIGDNISYDNASLIYTKVKPRLHTAQLNQSVGREYWLNGEDVVDATTSNTDPLISWNGASIGSTRSVQSKDYYGDIGEIIFFTRALKNSEKQAIESYLIQKYQIDIS